MAPLPKRYGYKLPSTLEGNCVSVTLQFPDILEYRAAFNGAVNMLGKWFTWEHTQSDYAQIPELNIEVAQAWAMILANAQWSDCVPICEQIIACITGDTDVQNALREFIVSDDGITTHIRDTAASGSSLTPTETTMPIVSGCNPDEAWGAVDALIEQMNTNNVDFFQVFETHTNTLERVSQLASAIPAFGLLPFDELILFADNLFLNIYEEYEAVVTTELMNEYKCALFCMVQESADCFISFESMYDYWMQRIEGAFTVESAFAEVIEFLATGSWDGTLIVDFMMTLQLQVINSTNSFLGVRVDNLQIAASIGAMNPSNAWELICDDCASPTWEKTFYINFEGVGDWVIVAGVWVADQGVQNNVASAYPYTADIYLDIASWGTAELTSISVQAYSENIGTSATRGVYYPIEGYTQFGYQENTGEYTMEFTPSVVTPQRIEIQVSNNPTVNSGTNFIRSVTLTGTGPDPFA